MTSGGEGGAAPHEAAVLYQLGSILGKSLDLDRTLEEFLSHLSRAVQADAAAVFVASDRTGSGGLAPRRSVGIDRQQLARARLTERLLDLFEREPDQPVILGEGTPWQLALQQALPAKGLRTGVAAGLDTGSSLVGAMVLARCEAHPFRENELRLLGYLARRLAVVVDHALLHAELQRSLALSRAIEEAAPDGILFVDQRRRAISANRRFGEMWGIPEDILRTRDDRRLAAFVLPSVVDPDAFLDRLTYFYDHPLEEGRDEVRLRDGRVFERHSAPVTVPGGQSFGRVWFFRDITGRIRAEDAVRQLNAELERRVEDRTRELAVANRELEASLRALGEVKAQLMLADRLASVGTLAAGVAHEINNPLSYVIANLAFVGEELDHLAGLATGAGSPEHPAEEGQRIADVRTAIAEARSGADRVRNIVRDLKTFSRRDDEAAGPVDVSRVLDLAIEMASNEIRHRARLVRSFGEVPLVSGNMGRLGQVFLNLLLNAAQAIPEGSAEENEIRVSTKEEKGEVVVEIADTGTGIAPEILGRIFDPFFTTKPVGTGTGLGLSICHGIVSALGGQISVRSTLGEGATFRVALPALLEQASAVPSKVGPAAAPPARSRILVIDDEVRICRAVARMLLEHEVLGAEGGRAGLEILSSDQRFDLVLCDVRMPDVGGLEVYEAVSARWPELASRFVFITGGGYSDRIRTQLEALANPKLEKPFEAEAVRQLLRRERI
ncbi:MAG: response regulator [Myxococcales bacterium]|nr:response regulator [Myxococcales bacterium]